jgi:hypothetical protein
MPKRRHYKQTKSIQERLRTFAEDVRAKADRLPPGLEKDDLLRRARQADTTSHLAEWANSPGLQSPK